MVEVHPALQNLLDLYSAHLREIGDRGYDVCIRKGGVAYYVIGALTETNVRRGDYLRIIAERLRHAETEPPNDGNRVE